MGLRPKPRAGRTAACGAGPAGGWLGWNWLVWFGMVGLELGWFGNAIAVFQTAERGPRNSTHFRIILRLENAHASSMPDLVQLSCDAQPRLEICLLPRRLVRGSGGRYYDRLRTGLLQCELDGVHRRHRAQPRGGRLHRGSGKLRGRSPKLRRGLGRERGEQYHLNCFAQNRRGPKNAPTYASAVADPGQPGWRECLRGDRHVHGKPQPLLVGPASVQSSDWRAGGQRRAATTAWRIRVWRWRRTPAASMPHSIARPWSSTTWRQAWWHPPVRPRGL